MGWNCRSVFLERRMLGFFDRRRRLENVCDMGHFNVARLRGCTTLHWLKLSEVIGNNAGESFLFIGPGVNRQFRGPLQIVLTRKRQKER
jgi:hypothetical protein